MIKLTTKEVNEIRDALAEGVSQTSLARQYGVNCSTISRIKDGKCHQNIRYVCKPINDLVHLTIDEAKLIFEALLKLPVEGNKALLKKTLIPLKGRIEQAEMSKQST